VVAECEEGDLNPLHPHQDLNGSEHLRRIGPDAGGQKRALSGQIGPDPVQF